MGQDITPRTLTPDEIKQIETEIYQRKLKPQEIVAIATARTFGESRIGKPLPQNGIVILFDDTCPHCQYTLRSTKGATSTANGTPVEYIDTQVPDGAKAYTEMPGMEVKDDKWTIGGTHITGVPVIVMMVDGKATKILRMGELDPGDLDMLVAKEQALSQPNKGTTVPNQPVAKTASPQR